jgi:hypothetical protein
MEDHHGNRCQFGSSPSMESTAKYRFIEVEDALEIFEPTEI